MWRRFEPQLSALRGSDTAKAAGLAGAMVANNVIALGSVIVFSRELSDYGSLAALPHLKRQGGALINVGSEVSDAVVPLQGYYSASKHAVKGFTDALRVEVVEVDEAPV